MNFRAIQYHFHKWLKGIQESRFIAFFKSIGTWFRENIVKRKLIIFFSLLTLWSLLLGGALLSPESGETYSSEQLATKKNFYNGSGEINLVKQVYSQKTGIILLQFETDDSISGIDRGIDNSRLSWKLYSSTEELDTSMEVIPITDKKISVIIKNVPKNFGALVVDIENKSINASGIDVELSSSDDETAKVSSVEEEFDRVVQFWITPQNSKLEKEEIKDVSRESFAISEIDQEIKFQEGQIKKLNTSIQQLKDSISEDESSKKSLSTEAQYLENEDLIENQRSQEQIDNSIADKNQSIEKATDNIEIVKSRIVALKKKKQAVKDGTFEFPNPIQTVEMKEGEK